MKRESRAMRTIFVMSLACALLSLLAALGLSVTSVVPESGAESLLPLMILGMGVFIVWLRLAFWVRARNRASTQQLPPQWLRRLLIGVSIVYLLGVFFLLIG